VKGALDLEARRALLDEAAAARADLGQKPAAEAATALAILLRDGLTALERAFDPSTRIELGAASEHWLAFRRATAPVLAEITREHGPAGAAFFLGWLKRLAVLSEPPTGRRPSQASTRQACRPATFELKAGDVVDAVLLEERTKKGGWKAQHLATGLTGPIVNSDAVPSDREPGETIKLVINAVTRREASFRYSDEARSQT
jgi:hypothetical protein